MVSHLEFMPRLSWIEAQQKMQCTLRSTNGNIENVSDGGSYSLSKKSLLQNHYMASSKEEVSALVLKFPDQRYFILAFFGSLPLQGLDQTNHLGSEANENMDRFVLGFPAAISFQVDAQRALRNPPHRACSAKSFITSSFFGSNVRGQSQNRGLVNRRAKMHKVSGSSSQKNSSISSDSSSLICDVPNANCADDLVKDLLRADKPAKRCSKKKAKKKGKRSKRRSRGADTTKLEVFSEEGVRGSPVSETCTNNDLAWDDGYISDNKLAENAVPPAASLQITLDGSDSEENSNCISNHSATPMTSTSYSDGLDASDTIVPSVPHTSAGEDSVVNSANVIHTSEVVMLPTLNGEVADAHLKDNSYCNGISSEVFSGHNATSDSISDGWNSDVSTNAVYNIEEKSTVKEDKRISLSESSDSTHTTPLPGSGKRNSYHGNFSNRVVDSDSYAERTKCGSQGCSGSGMNFVVSGKRGRQCRELSGISSGMHRLSTAENLHGRSRKETSISVWQKVRRNDINEYICKTNAENTSISQFNTASKKVPSYKRVSNFVDSDVHIKSKDYNNSKVKVSEKLKRKPDAESKQEYCNYSRKGPHDNKANSNRATKVNLLQEALEIPYYVNHHKDISIGSGSDCCIDCPGVGLIQTDRVDCNPSEPVQNSQVCQDELKQLGSVCTEVSDMIDQAAQSQNCLSSGASESLGRTHLLEVQSCGEVHLPVSNRPSKIETDASCAEIGKQDHNSGSVLQRWMPVVRKDTGMTGNRRSDKLSESHLDESVGDGWPLKNVEEEPSSSAHSLFPVMDAVAANMGSSSWVVNGPPHKDEGQVENLTLNNTFISKAHSSTHTLANCLLTRESKDHNICVSETDSNKITKAVNDAYKIQLASEGIELATGSPLAEFERLLCSASPVLGQTHSLLQCQSCLGNQFIGTSLCRHEIPNISLGNLWQWYDKHGSYGLEVRAEDYWNSKRKGIDCFEFRAYFVPFLSAVQLFGNSRSHSVNTSNKIPSAEVLKACHASENSSSVSHLPIISLLLPKPRGENKTSPPENSLYFSESPSVSGQIDFSTHSQPDDSELLFEYFESEQPQQRRPLFEKIKELVRGDVSSNCQAYGDPTKLVSLDLHDLHPASWYAVAWYPIYRIPDGNFRAAFLTYHCLGHLVQSTSSYCLEGDACIVSPVVGLQSYNAQGECWFQLRHNVKAQTEETSTFNRSEILKERLRTLEQTASTMARAVVSKGNLRSVNRQPDYEFFLSRRRW